MSTVPYEQQREILLAQIQRLGQHARTRCFVKLANRAERLRSTAAALKVPVLERAVDCLERAIIHRNYPSILKQPEGPLRQCESK